MPDDVNVVSAVAGREAEWRRPAAPVRPLAQINEIVLHDAQASRHSSQSWGNLACGRFAHANAVDRPPPGKRFGVEPER